MSTSKYIPEIDGLRAISIIAVIIFHVNASWLPGGFLGVDVFFVISGFLITNILKTNYDLKEFYRRRILRLFPSLIFTLLISTLFAYILFFPKTTRDFGDSLIYSEFYLSNFFFMFFERSYFDTGFRPLLQHTWSLAIEEQFYLIYPALFPFFLKLEPKKKFTTILLLCLAMSLFSFFLFKSELNDVIFFASFPRGLGLILGCGLSFIPEARFNRNSLVSCCCLLVLLGSFFFIGEKSFNTLTTLPLLVSTSILIVSRDKLFSSFLLGNKVMTSIGLRSYSLYLIHWPLFAFSDYFSRDFQPRFWLLAVLLTLVNYNLIEQKFRYLRISLKQAINYFLILPAIFFITIFISIKLTNGWEFRFKEVDSAYHKVNPDPIKKWSTDILPYNLYDPENAHSRILLYGDSHAGHFQGFSLKLAKQFNAKLDVLAYGNCTPGYNGEYSLPKMNKKDITECIYFFKNLLGMFDKFDIILLAGYYTDKTGNKEFAASLQRLLSELKAKGKKIVLLSQVPELHSEQSMEYITMTERFNIEASNIFTLNSKYIAANNFIKMIARPFASLYINFDKVLISNNSAVISDSNGALIYRDTNHINLKGSYLLAEKFLNTKVYKLERETMKSLISE